METKTLEEWRALKMPVVYFKKEPGKVRSLDGGMINYAQGGEIDFFNDKTWLYNSAKVLNKWASGEVLTEEEFDAGIDRAANHCPTKEMPISI